MVTLAATAQAAPSSPAAGAFIQQTVPSAPPTAGAILQQNAPRPAPATVPPSVLTVPAPQRQASNASEQIEVARVELRGNTRIDTTTLQPLVAGLDGKTATLGELQSAAGRITAYYHSHGFPLAYAYLPAQNVKDGVVTIAIVEARYDHVEIGGSSRLRASQATRTLGVTSGEVIGQTRLDRGLLLLNQTPGIRVAGTLVSGATTGTSTLKTELSDTPLVSASLGMDNDGNAYTGRTRGSLQADINNPFGFGGQLGANLLRTAGGLLQSEGVNLLSPDIDNGFRLGVYGSYTSYTLGGQFAALDEHGTVRQWGISGSMPLILAPGRVLEARIDLLHDGLRQRNIAPGTDSRSHINLARLTLDGAITDGAGGVTSGWLAISSGTDSSAGNPAERDVDGTFWAGQLHVQHSHPLPAHFQLVASFDGQLASHALDGSQQFYLGGPEGVMGYAVGEGAGDAGVLARIKLAHDIPAIASGKLTAGLLLQTGKAWLRSTSGDPDVASTNLTSGGVEFDYRFKQWVHIEAAYAHPLGHRPSSPGFDRHGEFWASIALNI